MQIKHGRKAWRPPRTLSSPCISGRRRTVEPWFASQKAATVLNATSRGGGAVSKTLRPQTAARRAWKFRASARILTSCKPRFDTLSLPKSMLLQRFIMTPFLGAQAWEAPDPLPVMRRELKLLLIEMDLLRIEVEQWRSMRGSTGEGGISSGSVNSSPKPEIIGNEKQKRHRSLIKQGPPSFLFSTAARSSAPRPLQSSHY